MTDFQDNALQAFALLAEKFNLACTTFNDRLIRFQNDRVFLAIHHDGTRSFEIGVEIGERTQTDAIERSFNLGEILRLKHEYQDSKWVDDLQVSDKSHFPTILAKLAKFVETYATDLLNHDKNAFLDLSEFHDIECAKYAIEIRLQMARTKAGLAWGTKNYKALIEAFGPVRIYLSEVEKKQLLYAETRVAKE
jgi:hypothetical protein